MEARVYRIGYSGIVKKAYDCHVCVNHQGNKIHLLALTYCPPMVLLNGKDLTASWEFVESCDGSCGQHLGRIIILTPRAKTFIREHLAKDGKKGE